MIIVPVLVSRVARAWNVVVKRRSVPAGLGRGGVEE
jgi:hypothetical protein